METQTTTELTLTIPPELNELKKAVTLPATTSEQILVKYATFFHQMSVIKKDSAKIDFENPSDLDRKIARECRLKSVKIRTSAEAVKNEEKATALITNRLHDNAFGLVKNSCLLDEQKYVDVERFHEIAEAKRKEALKNKRLELLKPYNFQYTTGNGFNFGEMDEIMFNSLLTGCKVAFEERQAKEAQAETDRIQKENEDAEDRRKLRLENEKLKAENAKQEELRKQERIRDENAQLAIRKKAAEDRAIIEAKAKADKQAADEQAAKTQAYNDKVMARVNRCQMIGLTINKDAKAYCYEDINISFDNIKMMEDAVFTATLEQRKTIILSKKAVQAKVIKDEKDKEAAKLAKEKKERMALMAELKEKREEEEAEAKRIADEAKAKAKEEKKKRLQPDKDKLIEFATYLANLDYPILKSDEANVLMDALREKLYELSEELIKEADDIE